MSFSHASSPSFFPLFRGSDVADAVFVRSVQNAPTLGEACKAIRDAVFLVSGDPEAHRRLCKLSSLLHTVGRDHEHVSLAILPPHVQGVNYAVGTHETALNVHALLPHVLLSDAGIDARATVLHEDSTLVGHAGQRGDISSLVGSDGTIATPLQLLEGAVESRVKKHLGYDRSDRPSEVYASGMRFVEHNPAASSYTFRGGGDRIAVQSEILRNSSMSPILLEKRLQEAGFRHEDIHVILSRVRGDVHDALQSQMRSTA